MKTALIGYTGFVGSNLLNQLSFDDCYNSKNIEDIRGKRYDRVYIAGAPAVKWLANKEPENDLKLMKGLMENLGSVEMGKVILISTVDVYPKPFHVDENSKIDLDTCHPYGKHRLLLEQYLAERFNTMTVRLPGLFGKGLKKNIIFDFLNNNQVENIHPLARFQFYYLEHLAQDIEIAENAGLKVVNFATEPVQVSDIAEQSFGFRFENDPGYAPPTYDFYTANANLWGLDGKYLYSEKQILMEIKEYIETAGWSGKR